MKKIIIWGGTGNFRVLRELLKDEYQILGYFDNNENIAGEYRGIPYLGDMKTYRHWQANLSPNAKPHFIVSIGPGHPRARIEIHNTLKQDGLTPIKAVHRTSFVADTAIIGEGTQIYANATICVDVVIGDSCIVNTRASIDHECRIGDGSTVGPGAVLAGNVEVGNQVDIYTGAVVLPGLKIGDGAVIGAGAVVIKNVSRGHVMVGNPARTMRIVNHIEPVGSNLGR